jgi:hypothetical protein
MINPFAVEWALSDDATELYLVCKFLRIPPSEAKKLNKMDYNIILGFAIRELKEIKLRGML